VSIVVPGVKAESVLMELDLRASPPRRRHLHGDDRRAVVRAAGDRCEREAAEGSLCFTAGPLDHRERDRTPCSTLFRRWSPDSAAWPPVGVRLFLFDIDGTLVSVRGAGAARRSRGRSKRPTERPGAIDRYDFRGRTDLTHRP